MTTPTTTTKMLDPSKLPPRDRHAYELGLALVSKKLAAARLAEIARKAIPKTHRIVPSATPKEFSARRPATVLGQIRTHVVFQTFAD
jgi:hypothetical protein